VGLAEAGETPTVRLEAGPSFTVTRQPLAQFP
jgi:hypothetical protein